MKTAAHQHSYPLCDLDRRPFSYTMEELQQASGNHVR
jgi:hypothetical protein